MAVGPQLFVEVLLKDGFRGDVLDCLCSPGAKEESGLDVSSAGRGWGTRLCALGQGHQAMKGGNLLIKPVTTVILSPSSVLGTGKVKSHPIVYFFFSPAHDEYFLILYYIIGFNAET